MNEFDLDYLLFYNREPHFPKLFLFSILDLLSKFAVFDANLYAKKLTEMNEAMNLNCLRQLWVIQAFITCWLEIHFSCTLVILIPIQIHAHATSLTLP